MLDHQKHKVEAGQIEAEGERRSVRYDNNVHQCAYIKGVVHDGVGAAWTDSQFCLSQKPIVVVCFTVPHEFMVPYKLLAITTKKD